MLCHLPQPGWVEDALLGTLQGEGAAQMGQEDGRPNAPRLESWDSAKAQSCQSCMSSIHADQDCPRQVSTRCWTRSRSHEGGIWNHCGWSVLRRPTRDDLEPKQKLQRKPEPSSVSSSGPRKLRRTSILQTSRSGKCTLAISEQLTSCGLSSRMTLPLQI